LGQKEEAMISIGSVLHGPELKESMAYGCIRALMRAAVESRGSFEFGASPGINVVFHVPGSFGSPTWDGIRDAKFSSKRQLLMIQVAVPKSLVSSSTLKGYLVERLHAANQIAMEVFRKKGLAFPLADAEKLVERIKERLDSGSVVDA
jgi:hypothetical protein